MKHGQSGTARAKTLDVAAAVNIARHRVRRRVRGWVGLRPFARLRGFEPFAIHSHLPSFKCNHRHLLSYPSARVCTRRVGGWYEDQQKGETNDTRTQFLRSFHLPGDEGFWMEGESHAEEESILAVPTTGANLFQQDCTPQFRKYGGIASRTGECFRGNRLRATRRPKRVIRAGGGHD